MNTLRLYACGGMATNVVSHFVKNSGKETEGFAILETAFIDTSESNKINALPVEMIYKVDNVDGSGKLRTSNYQTLYEESKSILHKFKPGNINIVVHSGGGGTGNVIGPVLVSELLSRDELVIVILVGSSGSRIETENTLNTLKSYESISQKRGKPVNIFYRENTNAKPRGMVDSEVQSTIVLLATIFSGFNRELDSADLNNWLNYHKVTSFPAKLTFLDFYSKEIELVKGTHLISLVTLASESETHDSNVPVEYQATGYIPDFVKDSSMVEMPIHACLISGFFNSVVGELNNKIAVYDETRKMINPKSIISGNVASTEDGLVL